MKPTQVLQEIRKIRFEEAYEGWNEGRLTQVEAARILGVCVVIATSSDGRHLQISMVDPEVFKIKY